MSLAISFATVVGLLADFTSSRGQQDTLDIRDFTEWLRFQGHSEVIEAIERNAEISVSIKASLAEGRNELLSRLKAIEAILFALTAGEGPLRGLAVAASPVAALSAQSIEILVAFEKAQAGKALLHHDLEGAHLLFLDGVGSQGYEPSDRRFFEPDLDELVSTKLCTLSYNGSGKKLFHITRRGARVASAAQDRDSEA